MLHDYAALEVAVEIALTSLVLAFAEFVQRGKESKEEQYPPHHIPLRYGRQRNLPRENSATNE